MNCRDAKSFFQSGVDTECGRGSLDIACSLSRNHFETALLYSIDFGNAKRGQNSSHGLRLSRSLVKIALQAFGWGAAGKIGIMELAVDGKSPMNTFLPKSKLDAVGSLLKALPVAKLSNSCPQGQNVTIWLSKQKPVRFRVLSPEFLFLTSCLLECIQ